jgi:hypothetical protein
VQRQGITRLGITLSGAGAAGLVGRLLIGAVLDDDNGFGDGFGDGGNGFLSRRRPLPQPARHLHNPCRPLTSQTPFRALSTR